MSEMRFSARIKRVHNIDEMVVFGNDALLFGQWIKENGRFGDISLPVAQHLVTAINQYQARRDAAAEAAKIELEIQADHAESTLLEGMA